MSKRQAIRQLNAMLRNCEVGVEGYQKYAEVTDNHVLQDHFDRYRRQQAHAIKQLAGRVTALGGDPRYGSGLDGVVARLGYTMRGVTGEDANELLRSAHYNETVILDTSERLLQSEGLDESTAQLLRNLHEGARSRQAELVELIRMYPRKGH